MFLLICNFYQFFFQRFVQKKGLKFLGAFINKEDAIQARIEAEKKYFGEFRRDSQIDCDFPK